MSELPAAQDLVLSIPIGDARVHLYISQELTPKEVRRLRRWLLLTLEVLEDTEEGGEE